MDRLFRRIVGACCWPALVLADVCCCRIRRSSSVALTTFGSSAGPRTRSSRRSTNPPSRSASWVVSSFNTRRILGSASSARAIWRKAASPGVDPAAAGRWASPTNAAWARAVGPSSCGRRAPGSGGRKLKSGGMMSGALLTTVNSSGGRGSRPSVRLALEQAASSRAPVTRTTTPNLLRPLGIVISINRFATTEN